MKSLVFTAPARDDLSTISDHIALEDPFAAEKIFRNIVRTIEKLKQFPNLGRRGRFAKTRELIIADIPYIVAYREESNKIIILAVFHTARNLHIAFKERMSVFRRDA